MDKKHSQIVVRLHKETEKKLKRKADKKELTKAAYVRQLILSDLEDAR